MQKEELVQGIVEFVAKCQRPGLSSGWQAVGLSHAQIGLLYLLAHHESASVKEIAQFLGISKSAVTQLADPLLSKGLINRQTDAHDRRIARLSLNSSGSKALKKLSKHKFAGLRTSLETLDQKELQTLYKLHKKMAERL